MELELGEKERVVFDFDGLLELELDFFLDVMERRVTRRMEEDGCDGGGTCVGVWLAHPSAPNMVGLRNNLYVFSVRGPPSKELYLSSLALIVIYTCHAHLNTQQGRTDLRDKTTIVNLSFFFFFLF